MKIKFILIMIVGVLTCSFALASTDLGKELTIRVDQGRPAFGSQYAYDVDTAWVVTYTTNISITDLQPVPQTIQWNVYDTNSNRYLSKWQDTNRNSLMVDSLEISDASVVPAILANLKTLALVFATVQQDKVSPLFFLDTGKLCQTLPDHYVNLTLGKNGCDLK